MSEYHIPFNIQEEIMKRLPVKSLLQFRSVSKAWKSLIDSSGFIAAHSIHRHTQPQHLLVWYWDQVDELQCIFCIDDYTFPQKRYLPSVPQSIKQLKIARVVGSSQGLLCVYGNDAAYTTKIAVILNPSIRKYIGVVVPGKPCMGFESLGFGVCPVTSDPKIVAITHDQDFNPCKVMIYKLSSGTWNRPNNLPTAPIRDPWSSVVTDRFMYWIAGLECRMIMSFDVTNEKFKLVDLPDTWACDPRRTLSISKIGESLAVLECTTFTCTVVWMMEDGVESFKKVFTIQEPENRIVGFRKSGIPLMTLFTEDNDDESCGFVVYEPNSEDTNVFDMPRSPYVFHMSSYMESLLFLNCSNSRSY